MNYFDPQLVSSHKPPILFSIPVIVYSKNTVVCVCVRQQDTDLSFIIVGLQL